MGVQQLNLFGEVEFQGNRLYKVSEEPTQQIQAPKTETRLSGGSCRACNRYESSDGMFGGGHCGNCDCCKEKE
jgi:hypothetical protein